MPLCGVSSTMIRQRAAAGSRCGTWSRIAVAELIAERGLYR